MGSKFFWALIILIATLFLFMIFGDLQKPSPRISAMILIGKMENSKSIISSCQFDLSGGVTSCGDLIEIKNSISPKDEYFLVTGAGELIGVNFQEKFIVVIKPRKLKNGDLYFECSVSPTGASPLGCNRNRN